MQILVYKTLGLISLGALLGVLFNVIGPKPIPWSTLEKPQENIEQPAGDLTTSAMQVLSSGGFTYVLDARRKDDYCAGHIPGAVHFSIYEFLQDPNPFQELLERIRDSGLPIIIYCGGGECEDSHRLQQELRFRGFENSLVYAGGWEAWEKQGLAQEKCNE